jgi:hypothetical protein
LANGLFLRHGVCEPAFTWEVAAAL